MTDSTNDQIIIPFRVYGLQRTGTNLTSRLATDNYFAAAFKPSAYWKHGNFDAASTVDSAGTKIRVFICVRHPVVWLTSIYRYFQRHKGADHTVCKNFTKETPFEVFATTQHYRWPTPIARYNECYAEYLEVLAAYPQTTAIVRAEDLVDPAGQLATFPKIAQLLGFEAKREFSPIFARVDNQGNTMTQSMNWDWYRDEQWREYYNPDLLRTINENVLSRHWSTFHYEPVSLDS